MAKVLNIVSVAYRATLEEQDDTIVWLTHALKGAGADIDVLLRANAVNYPVRGQDASGLSFGGKEQTQPPQLANDVANLVGKGVRVLVCAEDLAERGLRPNELIDGVEMVGRGEIPALLGGYDHVWHW
jgi:intracellular sulfur oxidation DsrE/DsrF family protein